MAWMQHLATERTMPLPENIAIKASSLDQMPISIIGTMTENGLDVATKIVIDKNDKGKITARWAKDEGEKYLADMILPHLQGKDPVAQLRKLIGQPDTLPEIPKPAAPLPPPAHAEAGFRTEQDHEDYKIRLEDLRTQPQMSYKLKLPKSLMEAAEAQRVQIQEMIIDHLSRNPA
jgi:hypothetical protein